MARRTASTFQLRVTLGATQPPIWRRLLVPSDLTLGELHEVLQIAMGWQGAHPHQFIQRGQFYGVPVDELGLFEVHDENGYQVADLLRVSRDWLTYEYDFGDGWEHRIALEKVLAPEDRAPVCIKARGACPPEDIGGADGYARLLAAHKDPRHPDRDALLAAVAADFDPAYADILTINERLHGYRAALSAPAADAA